MIQVKLGRKISDRCLERRRGGSLVQGPAPSVRVQRGPPSSERLAAGESCDGAALAPNYLRLSQAERERLERQQR